MDDSRFKSARDLLSSFFEDEKLRRGGRYAEFFSSWKSLVGDHLASHSRVADIDKGILVVEAEHPGWIQLLQIKQSAILEGIAKRFPEFGLRAVVFRIGSARPDSLFVPESPPGVPAIPQDEAGFLGSDAKNNSLAPPSGVSKSFEEIADPALRALLAGLGKTLRGEN
jgi:hypothetical protein